jgi:hypothetical protein
VSIDFRLEREKTRVRTFLNELVENRKIFSRDIETLKVMIKEKSAKLKNITAGIDDDPQGVLSDIPASPQE